MLTQRETSSFSHQHPAWIRKFESIAQNFNTESNRGNSLSGLLCTGDMCSLLQGVDTHVGSNLFPVYVIRFGTSRSKLRSNCALSICTCQAVSVFEYIGKTMSSRTPNFYSNIFEVEVDSTERPCRTRKVLCCGTSCYVYRSMFYLTILKCSLLWFQRGFFVDGVWW